MSSSFDNRQELLLEHMKDLIQKQYPNLNDGAILSYIFDYLKLFNTYKKSKENNIPMKLEDIIKLNKLHTLIYGADFDEDEIYNTGSSSALVVDLFKSKFNFIKKLMDDTDNTSADLLRDLLPLLTVYYYKNKDRKKIINDYLNQIIIPAITGTKLTSFSKDIDISREDDSRSGISKTGIRTAIGSDNTNIPTNSERTQSRIAKKQKKEKQSFDDKKKAQLKAKEDLDSELAEKQRKAKDQLTATSSSKKPSESLNPKLVSKFNATNQKIANIIESRKSEELKKKRR